MTLLKIKRLESGEAIEFCRKSTCEVCGKKAHGRPHHIVTVGAGGPDHKYNLIQLCFDCHYSRIPAGKLSKTELFSRVAVRERATAAAIIAVVEQIMGRGIKL